MILPTKQKQTMAKRADLWLPVGREWDGRGVLHFWMQNVTFGMDGPWGPTVQHRELGVIGSLCCTTESEGTLSNQR